MTRLERLRKRLHLLETKLGELNQAEKDYIAYLKKEVGDPSDNS